MIVATADPTDGGTITGAGLHDEGTDVTLREAPNPGYFFVNWTENGNEVSTIPTYTISDLDANHTLVANFGYEDYIITATSDSPYTQNASSKGFQSMGQDTAEELNGRFTALQIAGEEMNANIGVITAILNSLDTLSRVDSVTFSELRDLAVTRNSYLEDIARYTKRIPAEMEMTLNNIYKRQEDLLNAIRRA